MSAPPDRLFAEQLLAALYDLFSAKRKDFDFYLPFLMRAASVLDVGCGTGALLHRAREMGHAGRLCGLDPAPGMLEQARRRGDIEWLQGDLGSVRFDGAFDLVVMTGHAFQVLLGDSEIEAALAAIRAALRDKGRFAFETRNPLACEWELWTPDRVGRITVPGGSVVTMAREVEAVRADGTVSFRHTFIGTDWDAPEISRSTLRFLDETALAAMLVKQGFGIENQFGDWDGRPLDAASPEIITIARRR